MRSLHRASTARRVARALPFPSAVSEPSLNSSPGTALLAFQNAVIVGFDMDEKIDVGLERVVKLQGHEVFGVGQLLQNKRDGCWAEGDQVMELLSGGSVARVGTDGERPIEPRLLPPAKSLFERCLDLLRDLPYHFS